MRPTWKACKISAGLVAMGVALVQSPAHAQLPVIGGGGVPAVPGVGGPAVGPGIGGALPTVPNVVPGTPNVVPRVPQVVPGVNNGNRNVLPNAGNAVNRAVNGQNALGPNMPLQLRGIKNSAIGEDGALGAALDNRNGRLSISRIEPNSLLNRAGFRVGDRILAVDRNWVRSLDDLSARLGAVAQAEGTASVYIARNGVRQWLDVDFAGAARPVLGVKLNDANGQVVVSSVNNASAAAQAGLQAGDRIVAINGQTINATADVATQLSAVANVDGKLNIDVIRNGVKQTLQTTVGTVNNTAHRSIGLVHDRVDAIRNQLNQVAERVDGTVRRDVDLVRQRLETLSNRVNDLTQDTKELAREDIEQIRDTASALRARINDVAGGVQDNLRSDLDRVHDEVAHLRNDVRGFAETTTEATRDLAGSTRQGLADMTKGINDDLRQLTANVKENARGSVDDLTALTAEIRDDVAQLGDGRGEEVRDRIDAVRDRLSDVRNRLGDFTVGDGDQSLDLDRLGDLRDRLAIVRDRLGDYRHEQLGETVQNVADRVDLHRLDRDRLANHVDELRDRLANLNLGNNGQGNDLTARINAIRDRIQNGFDQDGDRLTQLRGEVRDLRDRVNQLARNTRDAEGLEEARARIAALSDDVNDYVAEHFRRGDSDSPVERVGSRVQ